MKTLTLLHKDWVCGLLIALTLLFFVGSAFCETASPGALFTDPPFADPNDTMDMEQAWSESKVKHPDKIDADLYTILSYQMVDIWKPWIMEFANQKKVSVSIQHGADGTSAGALRRKEVDVSCYCGSPKKSDRMPGVEFHTIGVVPVVFYVNVDNPVNDISLEAAMKIFRGEINNWVDVGGEVMSIIPVARSHCKKRLGRWRPLNNMDNLSPSAIKVGSINDALNYVATTHGSIGYEILPRVAPLVEQGKVKVLTLNKTNPYDLQMLCQGKYPLYRTYTFTTWNESVQDKPLAKEMIEMLMNKTAENAKRIFFVPTSDLKDAGWKFYGNELVGEPMS